MNESTNRIIEMLNSQIQIRDETITALKKENSKLIAVIKENKRKYINIALVLSGLLMISSLINIYLFIR